MKTLLLILLCAVPAGAQTPVDRWAPSLPTKAERTTADIASWGTVLADVVLDARASWQSPRRLRAFELQGARVAVTYGAVFIAKQLVHRMRPCALDCGLDNPRFSFYSAHTALAFSTLGGPRLSVSLPLAVSTGGLRVAAGKHWLTDVLTGAAAGALTSRIR